MSISYNTQGGNDFVTVPTTSTFNERASIPHETVFYYRPNNDFQIYLVCCKEITLNELISQLLINYLYSPYNNDLYSNELFVFYFQHPNGQRIYHVTCEMISHSNIVQYLNSNIYGIELKQSEQQPPLEFSNNHKQNLEFHLKQFLTDYLVSHENLNDVFN
ncbi:8682_t:CDS:1 [Funneliformis geosporum]|uniref:4549_t:CDS:1 n=1 Tax=Funneliformis geosporum TaxID=1117311 RepID=A0A9W4WWD3_9GLOM|nr:8682_t:CDS:1 [Funneliformis geosporum]CAI2183998.1 4549_t:CDS:1 [Funneliformis geosporum]